MSDDADRRRAIDFAMAYGYDLGLGDGDRPLRRSRSGRCADVRGAQRHCREDLPRRCLVTPPGPVTPAVDRDACRNCGRPIRFVADVGWLHGEIPKYAWEENTCTIPHPVSCGSHRHGACPNGWTP